MQLKPLLTEQLRVTLLDYVTAIAWSPMCNRLAAATGNGEVQWVKFRRLAWADIPDSDTSPMLAAATRETVAMWLLMPEEGWQSWVLNLHSQTVLDVAFQPKTGTLASVSEDGWLILWQQAIETMQILDGATEGFSCLAWHSSGQYLAAGGQQGELFVWATGTDG